MTLESMRQKLIPLQDFVNLETAIINFETGKGKLNTFGYVISLHIVYSVDENSGKPFRILEQHLLLSI